MADRKVRHLTAREVAARIGAGLPPVPSLTEQAMCRVPGCHNNLAEPGAYDGFCASCAKERMRDGKWETPPLA
jgi:hypothetical protein